MHRTTTQTMLNWAKTSWSERCWSYFLWSNINYPIRCRRRILVWKDWK